MATQTNVESVVMLLIMSLLRQRLSPNSFRPGESSGSQKFSKYFIEVLDDKKQSGFGILLKKFKSFFMRDSMDFQFFVDLLTSSSSSKNALYFRLLNLSDRNEENFWTNIECALATQKFSTFAAAMDLPFNLIDLEFDELIESCDTTMLQNRDLSSLCIKHSNLEALKFLSNFEFVNELRDISKHETSKKYPLKTSE